MSSILSEIVEPGVAVVTMNRPERKNALDRDSYRGLIEAFRWLDAEDEVRAIVLTGADGCFTSGNDIRDFVAGPEGLTVAMDFLHTIAAVRKPVVAAVEGFAIGIGTTVLLHCDLAYAGQGSVFRLPFATLGLVPEGGSSHLLPLVAGPKRAAELLMLGEAFGPDAAAGAGLLNGVVASGDARAMALAKARALAAQPPAALALTKSLLKRGSAAAVAEAIGVEAGHFAERLRSPEAAAAFATFLRR